MTYAPLYVSRKLLNGDEVVRHLTGQGLRSTLDPAEMHVTVLYSKQPLHWEKVPVASDNLVVPPMRGARGAGIYSVDRRVEKMGEHGVVVLCLDPQNEGVRELIDRHNVYRSAGASHDYDEFRVHVTVSYVGGGVDTSRIKPFSGVLLFGPEIRKPIEKEWKPDMTEEHSAEKSLFSASVCGCGAVNMACTCQSMRSGDQMTTVQNQPPGGDSPRGVGYLARALGKAFGRMTPDERVEFVKDAAVASSVELGKATDLLEMGDDHERPGRVEDLFDGPPDDRIRTVRAQGPRSSVPPGSVGVGSPQDASGGGSMRMENQYSEHAPQTGVQAATEELGRKLAAQGRAMKSLLAFSKSVADRLGLVETTMAAAPPAIDKAIVSAAVSKAVQSAVSAAVQAAMAKAVPEIVRAVAKAKKAAGESENDDTRETESGRDNEEEDEDEDEESEQAESGSGVEIEIDNEVEDEAEDEDEADEAKKAVAKAAARERLIAKSLIRLARAAVKAAEDAMADGMMHAGKRHHGKAKKRMMKALTHASIAKSLRGGKAGDSMKSIEKSIAAVDKSIKETKAKNQDKWPASTAKPMGKSDAVVTQPAATAAAAAPAQPDTKAIQSAVEKALSGMALLTADVQKLMTIVGGQSRDPAAAGGPPVEALFKADAGGGATPEAKLNVLAQSGAITMQERDKGLDALSMIKIPGTAAQMIDAYIGKCAPTVQTVLRQAA